MSCNLPTVGCKEPGFYVASWNTDWHLVVCIKHADAAIRWALGLGPTRPPSLASVVWVCRIADWKEKR